MNDEAKNYEIEIDKERRTYTSIKYDITIIELKKNDHLNNVSFFVIDEKIYDPKYKYKDISIFLLHYSKEKKSKISLWKINNIFKRKESYKIQHLCDSDEGSSGGPLINSLNGKVFGIHKGVAKGDKNYNEGTLLKEPIIEFENMIKNKDNKNELEDNNKAEIIEKNNIEDINEITIRYKIEDCSKEIRIFGDKFVKNNRYKCKIIVCDKEFELESHINVKNKKLNDGILEIKLKGIKYITDMSDMFKGEKYWEQIPLLSLPEISNWNTQNVTNMSNMFSYCESLKSLPDISKKNTINVHNMNDIFYCY